MEAKRGGYLRTITKIQQFVTSCIVDDDDDIPTTATALDKMLQRLITARNNYRDVQKDFIQQQHSAIEIERETEALSHILSQCAILEERIGELKRVLPAETPVCASPQDVAHLLKIVLEEQSRMRCEEMKSLITSYCGKEQSILNIEHNEQPIKSKYIAQGCDSAIKVIHSQISADNAIHQPELQNKMDTTSSPTIQSIHCGLQPNCLPILSGQLSNEFPSNHQPRATAMVALNANNCKLCNQDAHLLFGCAKFLAHTPEERYKIVIELKLCTNCLAATHNLNQCNYRLCRKCNAQHNILLHENFTIFNSSSVPSKTKTPTF